MKKQSIFLAVLSIGFLLIGCQNSKKEVLDSWSQLVDVVKLNNQEYKLQYEPHLVKRKKTKAIKVTASNEEQLDQFQDHHYFNLSISGLESNTSPGGKDNWTVLSPYLSDEFKNRFYLVVNGERKTCVLHHAFFPPQNTNTVMVQLVFKDQGFSEQANYFKEDLSVVYFDKKNGEKMEWSFSYKDLNQFPTLNNNYNG